MTNIEVREFSRWQWHIVIDMLKNTKLISKKRLENANIARFFRRLLTFFSPVSNTFHTLQIDSETETYAYALSLLTHLLCESDEGLKFLGAHGVLGDVSTLLADLRPETSMISTEFLSGRQVCAYFEMISVMCKGPSSRQLLVDSRIFGRLYAMCERGDRDDLLQVILKKLPWDVEGHPRVILTHILTAVNAPMRRYATERLRLQLLSANPSTCSDWKITMLVRQLYDRDADLRSRALHIVDEGLGAFDDCYDFIIL